MKLFTLLVFLSAQICFGSKWMSVETKFSRVEHVLKQIEKNPDYGTYCRARSKSPNRYAVQFQIPPGAPYYYGEFNDQTVARKAVSMIAEKYKKSLELNSPATFLELKLKCEEMFARPKCLSAIPAKLSLTEKIEQNPDYGIVKVLRVSGPPSYTIQTRIPPKVNHFYGTLHDKLAAQKAVSMLAKEYLESLKEGKSPATAEDLQKKYDAMFGENFVSRFEKKVEKIRNDPNFGVILLKNSTPCSYTVLLSIPPGEVHWYGLHHDHTSARKAVLMIAEDYLKSLEDSPATYHELRQKYGSMKKKLPSTENKLVIAEKNGEKSVLMSVQNNQDRGKTRAAKLPSPTSTDEGNSPRNSELRSESTLENFPSVETPSRNPIEKCDKNRLDIEVVEVNGKENVLMSLSKKPMNKLYKVVVSRLQVDESVDFPYVDGWRTHLERGEVFTVTEKRRLIDNFNGWNRIRGYCEECGGWVTLKHLDIGLEGAEKVKKRKRKASETSSGMNESMEESTNYGSDFVNN